MKVSLVRNILFVLIGIIAIWRASTYTYSDFPADILQLFALVMFVIGGCGIYQNLKVTDPNKKPSNPKTPETKEEVEQWLNEGE